MDIVSGNYIVFNETEADKAKVVVSSASMPFIFPNRKWEDRGVICMDGGTTWNVNLVSAIERCREIVDDDSDITIDIISADTHILEGKIGRNAYHNYLIFQDLKKYFGKESDVVVFMKAFPTVNFRYYVEPSIPLPAGSKLLDFDNSTNTYGNQMQGRIDGKKVIEKGEGVSFQELVARYEGRLQQRVSKGPNQ